MTRNIFLLSMMSPLDERLCETLSEEILKRGTTVAYISSSPQSGDRPFYQSTIAAYEAISPDIRVDYFDLSDAFTDEMLAGLSSYAAIYLSGGNTFTFMDSARKRGLKALLEQYLAEGGVLIGASAGSIMCTPSIELAKFGDENEVGMTDFSDSVSSTLNFTRILRASKKSENVLRSISERTGEKSIHAKTEQVYMSQTPTLLCLEVY